MTKKVEASEVVIKKVVLKIGDKELSLSIEDAKKLHEVLAELFKEPQVVKEVVKEEHHHYPSYPVYPTWPYTGPVWITQTGSDYHPNQIFCSTQDSDLVVNLPAYVNSVA